MLCVTGNEARVDDLAQRLRTVSAEMGREDHLQEVRLDALAPAELEGSRPTAPWLEALRPFADRLIVTCRPARQGGGFEGAETHRLQVLETASELSPAWIDVEADCPAGVFDRIGAGPARHVLASWHVHRWQPEAVTGGLDLLVSRPAAAHKLAVQVDDAAQLRALRELTAPHPSVLAIGMGESGLLSRCRYPCFGAPWTYVSADQESATAPGQLTLAQARELGLPEAAEHGFFCLVGGAQVRHSPGPRVYNRLFRARGRPWSYVAVASDNGREALTLVEELGALGASVTMPHKACALAMGDPDSEARRVGAANTLRFGSRPPAATNTDVAGVREPLLAALDAVGGPGSGHRRDDGGEPWTALVLGAGGAARAAVQACLDLGLRVIVSARRLEAAEALGDAVERVPWARRAEAPAQVLLNATPVSGARVPWPEGEPLGKEVVFDLALADQPSTLLALAASEGARTLEALEMWLTQGAVQLAYLTGDAVSTEDLRMALA